ncbi:MAG: transglycosylase domain-containing protein [bacterium]|nr:transglycosylase domain-containing protein [bacterium]
MSKKENKIKKLIFCFFRKNYKLLIIFGLSAWAALFLYFFWGLPSPWNLEGGNYPVSTKIFDRNGELLYEIYTEKGRTPTKLSDLPPYVKWATISAEDKDFYSHHGFSWTGILRASFNTVFRRHLEGGSTITQQLVKNALLTPDRTIKRKVREFALTVAVEASYPKDKILEMYLNNAPYGGTSWGIEAASKTYFGKDAKDLTLSEVAMLAGLPASPTRYSPFGAHPELAKQRQEFVLQRMVEDKRISAQEADEAKKQDLSFQPQAHQIKAPHFVMMIKEQLDQLYGAKMVEQGGLRVTTSLDLQIQDLAETVVASEVGKLKNAHVTNGAVLVTKPKTGEILAMVGSKDYFDKDIQGNFNVTTALRQPGSSIKPVNYALGLLTKRITLATPLNDMPTCFSVFGQAAYCPANYDNSYHGPIQARFALGNSLNIPAVKVLALNSLEEFVPFAQKMGLSTLSDPSKYGLSLTLGGGEVKMTDMAVAFGDFANLGVKQPLITVLKTEDYKGKVILETKIQEGERIIPMEVAYLIDHTLLDNNARSAVFGATSYLVISGHPEVSVKTGTTNDKRDNWTIGFNPDFLVVAWVGNNDNSPMGAVASGVSGASPIWNKIMTYVLKDQKQNWPSKPEGVVGATVCSISGKAPGDSGCPTRFEYFLAGTVPSETENLKQTILINKDTNQMVLPNTDPQPPNVEFQDHPVITDPLGTNYCLDCIPATDPVRIKTSDIPRLSTPTP